MCCFLRPPATPPKNDAFRLSCAFSQQLKATRRHEKLSPTVNHPPLSSHPTHHTRRPLSFHLRRSTRVDCMAVPSKKRTKGLIFRVPTHPSLPRPLLLSACLSPTFLSLGFYVQQPYDIQTVSVGLADSERRNRRRVQAITDERDSGGGGGQWRVQARGDRATEKKCECMFVHQKIHA